MRLLRSLRSNNAVVTTLNSGFFGKANSTLDEGQYRIRIKHPKFGAEVRHVQIMSGQTAEIRVQLHSGPQLHEAITLAVSTPQASLRELKSIKASREPTGSVLHHDSHPQSWPYEK